MKLGLGTVQFGLNYGISNKIGKIPQAEVAQILKKAREKIDFLDTAFHYGESEAVLGSVLDRGSSFKMITKTRQFKKGVIARQDAEVLKSDFQNSLKLLKQESVYGLLMHRPDDLSSDLLAENAEWLFDALLELKSSGRVKKIGISIYTPEQGARILERFPVDLIQLPLNWLDQRFLENGFLARLKTRGIEIHARSVFLQGLLLMDPDTLSDFFDPFKAHLQACRDRFQKAGLSRLEAALQFVLGQKNMDGLVFSVTSVRELEEILRVAETPRSFNFDFSSCALHDGRIINPLSWETGVLQN